MDKKFYFMAGLPRAGSTLLSTLLNQNPRFYSGPSSPVLGTMHHINNSFIKSERYKSYPKPKRVNEIIGSIIKHWYSDIDKPIIIDNNTGWCNNIPFIEGYLDIEPKIIVPVRRVDEILTSMLTMIHRNPFEEGQPRINFVDEQLVKNDIPISDETRCNHLINQGGIVWESLNAIKLGIENGHGDKFLFIDYNNLVEEPQEEMEKIYEFLNEESFEHTFDGLSNQYKENDLETYGLSDMHEVHSKVEKISIDPSEILPDSIIEIYNNNKQNLEFWDDIKVQSKIINPNILPNIPKNNYNLFSQ